MSMGQWLPIESAPENTPVLIYEKNGNYVTAKLWHECWCLIEVGGYAEDADLESEPTHWMSLPEPPQ